MSRRADRGPSCHRGRGFCCTSNFGKVQADGMSGRCPGGLLGNGGLEVPQPPGGTGQGRPRPPGSAVGSAPTAPQC
eukprot:1291866-Pyramimonas_sp.AAC.1